MKSLLSIIVLCCSVAVLAQPDASIVGNWVAVHRSNGGIGSLWEFNKNGTLRMGIGAMVDMPYKVEGDKLILPPGTTNPGAKPQVSRIKIEGGVLTETFEEGHEPPRKFVRSGPAKSGDVSIVGTWKPVVDDPPKPNEDAMQAAQRNATYTYTRDGVLKLRMPFSYISGTYDVAAHTFSLDFNGATAKGAFRVTGDRLFLTQPNAKKEDEYLKETAE